MKWLNEERTIMGLYDIDSEKIRVFKLEPKEKEFTNYKKSELNKIDKDRLVYVACTLEGEPLLRRGYLGTNQYYTYMNGGGLDCDRKTDITSYELCFDEKDMYNQVIEKHSFKPWDDKLEKKLANRITKQELIDEYCKKLDPSKYLRVFDNNHIGVDAIILAGYDYEYVYGNDFNFNKLFIYPRIINIPITLYNLELFLHGNFNILRKEELEQILSLYNYSERPLYSAQIKDLKRMYEYLPVPGVDIESQISFHDGDANVLKLLKK